MLTLTSFPSDLFQRHFNVILTTNGGMSTTLVASKIKCFVTLINYFQIMANVILICFGVALEGTLLELHHFSIGYLHWVFLL